VRMLSIDTRVIRDFGDWELVLADLASGDKLYVNKESGEAFEDPPPEVLDVLAAENSRRRRPVYETTPHLFAPLPCMEIHSSIPDAPRKLDQPNVIRRVDILDADGAAFVLHNFLSPEECQDIIDQAEAFGFKDCGYDARIRVTDRVSIMGDDLANILFRRASPHLVDVEARPHHGVPHGIRPDVAPGLWRPYGLNPCFRVCRYTAGGVFLPHHDGGFDCDREHRSLMTFMLYLNDVDECHGGLTTFYEETQKHYAEPSAIRMLHRLRPERGALLVFYHNLTHDGGMLTGGTKYILRTEVMYHHESRP